MFQGLLENLLQKVLGEYIDIDSNKLSMSVYSGVIDLKDLQIKKNILKKLNIPMQLIIGRIEKLYVYVPWNALSSKPVQIEITGLQILVKPLQQDAENSAWLEFVEEQNKFANVETRMLDYALKIFNQLVQDQMKNDAKEQQQGFIMNLTSKVLDNIQLLLKNIHFRFEDPLNFTRPLAFGLTMEKLEMDTCNEKWEREFFDRTNPNNKLKPLLKIFNLRNIGYYCNPKDIQERQICLEESEEKQMQMFNELFPKDSQFSATYEHAYVQRPITVLTKLKQLSVHYLENAKKEREPMFQMNVEISEMNVQVLKSQYEAMFKVIEQLNDFALFTDNYINRRAVTLNKFYSQDYQKQKDTFQTCLVKMLKKKVKEGTLEGKTLSLDQQAELLGMIVMTPEQQEIYTKIVTFENQVRIQKWVEKTVKANFEEIHQILLDHKKQIEQQQNSSIRGYIGGTIGWIGSGASYIYYGSQTTETPSEQTKKENLQTTQSLNQSGFDTAQDFSDDEFQDALDEEVPPDIDSLPELEIFSSQIREEMTKRETFMQKSRLRKEKMKVDIPVFRGQFKLEKQQIKLIDDSLIQDLSKSFTEQMQESNSNKPLIEILLFGDNFMIDYNHYDAKDLTNQNQISIFCSSKDMGVKIIKQYLKHLPAVNERLDLLDNTIESVMETEVNDFIYKSNYQQQETEELCLSRDHEEHGEDLMHFEIVFGNQNIKEDMISRQESTKDFIDQSVYFHFRSVTVVYRHDLIETITKFFQISVDFNDKTKLMAQDEYEKLRETLSIQHMLEAQSQIQNNIRIKMNLDSGQILLPIFDPSKAKQNFNIQSIKDAWIFNTGNLEFKNRLEYQLSEQKVFDGEADYTPQFFKITGVNMKYVENLAAWFKNNEVNTQQVLKDININMVVMMLHQNKKIRHSPKKPMMKVRLDTEEIKIVFEPRSYLHLVNVTRSLYAQTDNQESNTGGIDEKVHIFKNCKAVDLVLKRTEQQQTQYTAVLSGSYIYFFNYKEYRLISESLQTYLEHNTIKEVSSSSEEDDDEDSKSKKSESKISRSHCITESEEFELNALPQELLQLKYIDYYLIKGCNEIETAEQYQEKIKKQGSNVPRISHFNLNLTQDGSQVSTTIKMKNSMGVECILDFKDKLVQYKWVDVIKAQANEIDVLLGRDQTQVSHSFSLQQQETLKTPEHHQDDTQVLAEYNISLKKFEIVIESPSYLFLNSHIVNKHSKDIIFLSAEQPKQFNRKNATKKVNVQWAYSLSFKNFRMIYTTRLYDSDCQVNIQSMQIMDQSNDNRHPEHIRFPMLLKSQTARGKREDVFKIKIQWQVYESPRFDLALVNYDINIGTFHLNWQPVSFNRILRFFRYMFYIEDVYKREAITVKQSFQLQLQKLHSANINISNMQRAKLNKKRSTQADGLMRSSSMISFTESSRKDCKKDQTIMMSVRMQMNKITLACIHPQNDSLPVFTMKIDLMKMNYDSLVDHDEISGTINNFRIFDNTNYPRTLDPYKQYTKNDNIPSYLYIFFKNHAKSKDLAASSRRTSEIETEEAAIKFKMTMFHFPLDYCCPIQNIEANQKNDKLVKMEMKQLQINHMHEVMFRLNDYFFYQLLYAATDANPYQDLIQRIKIEFDPFTSNEHKQSRREELENLMESRFIEKVSSDESQTEQSESMMNKSLNQCDQSIAEINGTVEEDDYYSSSDKENTNTQMIFESEEEMDRTNNQIPDENNYQFKGASKQNENGFNFKQELEKNEVKDIDLKQYPLTTQLDISIENPMIVLKDRPYFKQSINIDLGRINITSSLKQVKDRWLNNPEKSTIVNVMQIMMKQFRMDFNENEFMITPPFDMNIEVERVNFSEVLCEDYFLTKSVDFEVFDFSEKINIKSTAFKMNFKQEIYTYLLRVMDLNVNYYDMISEKYQLYCWDSHDFMKYLNQEEQVVQKYKNSMVSKRKINFSFPSLSIQCLEDSTQMQNQLLSELIMYNLNISMLMHLDYRKQIEMKSHTFFLLYKDYHDGMASKQDLADPNYKTLIVGPIKSKKHIRTTDYFYNEGAESLQQKNSDYIVAIKMEADGAKTVEVTMKGLKVFIKLDVLYILQNFFNNNWPEYHPDAKDKPTYFEADFGNYPSNALTLNLKDCLTCFEQISSIRHEDISTPRNKFQDKAEFNLENQYKKYFSKTIAFQGQLQFFMIRETANKIKDDLIAQVGQENISELKDLVMASLKEQREKEAIKNQNRLWTQQVHIIDFKPFFCDIKDLEDGMELNDIYKRQFICPFNLYVNQTEMIEVVSKKIKSLNRQFKQAVKTQEKAMGSNSHSQKHQKFHKARLLSDSNFKYFYKTELNLDLAEITISFNDMLILKGIQFQFNSMNKKFEEYYKTFVINKQQKSSDKRTSVHSLVNSFDIDQQSDEEASSPDTKTKTSLLKTKKANLFDKKKKFNEDDENQQSSDTVAQQVHRTVYKTNYKQQVLKFGYKQEEEFNVDSDSKEIEEKNKRITFLASKQQQQKLITSLKSIPENTKEDEEENQPTEKIKGVDVTQVISYGLKMILINDIDNNFLPVLSLNFSNFKVQMDQNQKQMCFWTDLHLSANFFNVNIGVWEPFFEKFGFKFMINTEIQAKKQNVQFLINTPLNINVTEKLLQNIHESSLSWATINSDFDDFMTTYVKELQWQDKNSLNLNSDQHISYKLAQMRKTIMMTSFGLDLFPVQNQNDKKKKGSLLHSSSDPKINEESITPYVIINKTDSTFTVKRLFEKDRKELVTQEKIKSLSQEQVMHLLHLEDASRNKLINYFELKPGEAIEYMVDYNKNNNIFDKKENTVKEFNERETFAFGTYEDYENEVQYSDRNTHDSTVEVHLDAIGEYKSEYIKIQFDSNSNEVKHNLDKFSVAKEIKKIDLNDNGFRSHILREGKYMEKVFYGVRLIDFKKVFTVRSQHQLVNLTNYDYLIHFRFKKYSVLKFLESGGSIPLTMRYDESKLQIKMIVEQSNHRKTNELQDKAKQPEEILAAQQDVLDFRQPELKFKNWSKFIALYIIKDSIQFNNCSFITNDVSKFTFIKKTKADFYQNIIDINLMPPMIIKNSLPCNLKLQFKDSSGVDQKLVFSKNQEQSLFCFKMDTSVIADLILEGFKPVSIKLYDLSQFNQNEYIIDLEDLATRKTKIYAAISRENTGQKLVFYCKKLLIDTINSNLQYFYQQPQASMWGSNEREILSSMIPCVVDDDIMQTIYIIPFQNHQVFAANGDDYLQDNVCINIESQSIQGTFKLQNKEKTFNYSYYTQLYLATEDQSLYTKITTINPFYILVNQSNYTILVEQAEFKNINEEIQYQLPIILQPGQKKAFFFNKINNTMPGLDEFLHIKLLDEEISGSDLIQLIDEQKLANSSAKNEKEDSSNHIYKQTSSFNKVNKKDLMFVKHYAWSSPFMISEVDDFTLKIKPNIRKQRLQEQMNPLNNIEKQLLTKIMNQSQYIRVRCKGDIKQATGSMFIIIEEEDEAACKFKIINESKHIQMHFAQHIVSSALWNQKLYIDSAHEETCKVGESKRYTWDSLIHQHILKLSFRMQNASRDDLLELSDLSEEQEYRCLPAQNKKTTHILVPFNKIGQKEVLTLVENVDMQKLLGIKGASPTVLHKVQLSIETNGFSKFLKLTDINENQTNDEVSNHPDSITERQTSEEIKIKILDLQINQMTFSIIHRRCELLTLFVCKLQTVIQDTDESKNVKFSVGYLQIDNQSEADPVYPVLLKPKVLEYDSYENIIKILPEYERMLLAKENKGKEAIGTLRADDFKTFQFSIDINKELARIKDQKESENKNYPEVLYVDNIVFWLQTLEIKVQFSHFLKITNFMQDLGKILNKSVYQVHYVFINSNNNEAQPSLENEFSSPIKKVIFDFEEQEQNLSNSDLSLGEDDVEYFNINRKQFQFSTIEGVSQSQTFAYSQSFKGKRKQTLQPSTQSASKAKPKQKLEDVPEEAPLYHNKQKDRLKHFIKKDTLLKIKHNQTWFNKRQNKAIVLDQSENNWQCSKNIILSSDEWRIFIKEYQSSPTELIVSAINEGLQQQKEPQNDIVKKYLDLEEEENVMEDGVEQLLGSLGESAASKILYFSTFEDMEFQMNGLKCSNIFGQGSEVISELVNYHKQTFQFSVLQLLGASNMIGNPSRYISNLGTGMKDFFVKPLEGIQSGSLENFKEGFIDGSMSLLQNSLNAPVGAMAKISESLSKGTLALSYDDQFVEQKLEFERRNKAKNFSDGFSKGLKSAGTSIVSGVTGIVTQPIDGARQEGLKGFGKGIMKGAAGFFTKSFSGIIDIVAKTTEGLENQSKNKSQLKQAHRIRRPRPFYETNNILRPFNEFHAFWMTILPQIDKSLQLEKLYDVFYITEETKLIDYSAANNTSLYEQITSIFVITKSNLIEIKSTVKLKHSNSQNSQIVEQQDRVSQPTLVPINVKKTVNKVYSISHIDFVEIAGEDSNMLIIGFRQNQNDQKKNQKIEQFNQNLQKLAKNNEVTDNQDVILNLEEMKEMVPNQHLMLKSPRINIPDNISNEEEKVESGTSFEFTPELHRGSKDHSSRSTLVKSRGSDTPATPQDKMTPNQLNMLRTKLREQVERHKLKQHYSGDYQLVSSSNFHLQIEFENFQKARQVKLTIEKIKRVHRKERAYMEMLYQQHTYNASIEQNNSNE